MYAGTTCSTPFSGGSVGVSVLMGGKDGQPAPMWKRLACSPWRSRRRQRLLRRASPAGFTSYKPV